MIKISNSRLSRLYNALIGIPVMPIKPEYYQFGSELHSRALEGIEKETLSTEEEYMILRMLESLAAEKWYMNILKDAEVEKEIITPYDDNHELHGFIDIKNSEREILADLKTTRCKSYSEFLKSAINYGYFRQADYYKRLTGYQKFIFVGVQKQEPFSIFRLDAEKYPKHLAVAKKQIDFLLYYQTNYVSKTHNTEA